MAKFGRFTGGTHFAYLKKGMKDTTSKVSPRATKSQLQSLKDLGFTFQENSISKIRAEHLIKTIKEERKRAKDREIDNNTCEGVA